MSEKLLLTIILPVSPEELFNAWLDSGKHSAFTNSHFNVDPHIGGSFSDGFGYILGKTLEIEPGKRILQSWRTTDFPEDAPDSLLELLFEKADGGTLLTLSHTNLPDGQAEEYERGWQKFYFKPMKVFFNLTGT